MPAHPLARLEVSTRVLKRAQYEAFEFQLCDQGLLVRNGSHPDPENHEYQVTVANRLPTHCDCPADAKYEGACKHRVAVEIRNPVLDAAVHDQLAADGSGSSQQRLTEQEYRTTTGSQKTTNPSDDESSAESDDIDEEEQYPCECDDLTDDFPCWNCVLTGRRSLPDR